MCFSLNEIGRLRSTDLIQVAVLIFKPLNKSLVFQEEKKLSKQPIDQDSFLNSDTQQLKWNTSV